MLAGDVERQPSNRIRSQGRQRCAKPLKVLLSPGRSNTWVRWPGPTPPLLRNSRNRKREVSRPLFAIADEVRGQWPRRVRDAVVRLFQGRDAAPPDDLKTELLADIREAFGNQNRMSSADLVQALRAMEDRGPPGARARMV